LRAFRTRTPNVGKIEVAEFDKLAESARCLGSKVGFGLAGGAVSFGGVEADESDVGALAVDLDGVAVDNPNIGWVDRSCIG
jgi:hypothetical protein